MFDQRPANKRTWARVETDQRPVIEQGFAEAVRRDQDQQTLWTQAFIIE
jgi:hypothetical protein